MAQKQAIRAQILAALGQMSDEDRIQQSAQARQLLEHQPLWKSAKYILFYAPLPRELDIWPLLEIALRAGKQVALPRFHRETGDYVACSIQTPDTELSLGKFGIREPKPQCTELPLNRLDFALAPGVGFDLHGRRLGRGKGYYDRFLASMRGRTCGVAFENQIVAEIPVEPHDLHVNCILTPTRWLQF